MARPTLDDLDSTVQGWDTITNDNKDKLVAQPAPLVEYADYAALLAAAPANTFDRCIAVTQDGRLWISDGTDWNPLQGETGGAGAFGSFSRLVSAEEELLALAGASVSSSNLFPAGCYRLGASAFVTTIIAGPTDWDMEDSGSGVPDLYAAAKALAQGTKVDGTDWTASPFSLLAAAEGIKLDSNGGNFTSGAVRVVAHYLEFIAPTS